MCSTCYARWWNEQNPGRARARREKHKEDGTRAECHPDKPLLARGMCANCYRRWWRTTHPEEVAKNKEKNAKRGRDRYRSDPAKYRLRVQAARYGLTPDELLEMIEAQQGLCHACKEESPLQVDHCHQRGHVRGLLCNPCNSALGYAKENPARLRALADYAEASVPASVGGGG